MINTTVVQIQQIEVSTLLSNIDGLIENRLKSFAPKVSPSTDAEEFLTREEVATLLKISLPTLHDWCKKGLLNPFKIGNKVRFKKHEVMSSPKAINASQEVLQHGKK
jgi:excisionase family DNA binding protein